MKNTVYDEDIKLFLRKEEKMRFILCSVVIILSIFSLSNATVNEELFERLSKLAVFPPALPEEGDGKNPIGHKQPLGSQNAPVSPVKEYNKFLDPVTLWKNHVDPHKPLVYRGIIKDSAAVKHWASDEYMIKHYGDLDVLVEHKREDRTSTSGRMMLADFFKNYKTDDLYVVTMFPSEMMHEVKVSSMLFKPSSTTFI